MIENHRVQAERQRLRDAFSDGMAEGYYDAAKPLPSWYFDRPLARLTARERGWWYGRETRTQEEETK